ncbi:hypothetical protein Nepgr_003389 [Nepenthes gracilis]|uniref:Uncharacterized protein n=1 Tax=Nepenthes gracilis TaxID=150966 RepID=A0AAD3RZE3_NEPGR|nr:hypothetical protein Nepgr_003389 [Nepenthes gracilis]
MSDNDGEVRQAGVGRKTYLRSVSWTERSPNKPTPGPQNNSKVRSCFPPLQPLLVSRRNVEEWPKPGSDDLGVWPHPMTPSVRTEQTKPSGSSEMEVSSSEFGFKKEKMAFFDQECSRIADHIYLGSEVVAKNREILRRNEITHVLNCVGFGCPEYFNSDLVYKTLWLKDSPSEDITCILYDVFDYFEDVREQGARVLVHCSQGVSRSTSLVIAYLMWREGKSFEDAFQYVKAARGVTNPNLGFAYQLLQWQKRVHAMPSSPCSVLRMYRITPHSPYDPLHLVPKRVSCAGTHRLDSRGAFVIHVSSAIYVWIGRYCNSVMSNNAWGAAFQLVRYERALGPVMTIREGEEPSEFWDALSCGQQLNEGGGTIELFGSSLSDSAGNRKVDDYDQDFEIFNKALAGGVVPSLAPLSGSGSETCLPTGENGWVSLRRKFADDPIMKEFLSSSKLICDSDKILDTSKEAEQPISPTYHLVSTIPVGVSPGNYPSFSLDGRGEFCTDAEQDTNLGDSSFMLSTPYPDNSPQFSSKSTSVSPSTSDYSNSFPSLSPSTSDYSSSFTFSPSSSKWSELSNLSSQPSPLGLENSDHNPPKNPSFAQKDLSLWKTPSSCMERYSSNNSLMPCSSGKGMPPSIAERRGSNPPILMLPSADSPSLRTIIKSQSFSLSALDNETMARGDGKQLEHDGSKNQVATNLYELPETDGLPLKTPMQIVRGDEETDKFMCCVSRSSSDHR